MAIKTHHFKSEGKQKINQNEIIKISLSTYCMNNILEYKQISSNYNDIINVIITKHLELFKDDDMVVEWIHDPELKNRSKPKNVEVLLTPENAKIIMGLNISKKIDDVPLYIEYVIKKYSISEKVLGMLLNFDWQPNPEQNDMNEFSEIHNYEEYL